MREYPVYGPEDFASDTPPPRIIGSETEYLFTTASGNGMVLSNNLVNDITSGELGTVKVGGPNFQHSSGFLKNGSRAYHDCGMIEMASAESLGPAQAVETDKACQQIVQDYAARFQADYPFEIYRRTGFAHNLQSDSTGRHINLLTPPTMSKEDRDRHARFIASYIAARALWGSGMVSRRGFTWSQKFIEISNDDRVAVPAMGYGRRTGREKPILSWSTSQLGGSHGMEAHSKGWDRLEIRMADAPHSDFMRLIDFGGASLILRLIEHEDKLPDGFLEKMTFNGISMAVKNISLDLHHKKRYKTVAGSTTTALSVLKNCYEAYLELSETVQPQPDELLTAQFGLKLAEDFAKVDLSNPETYTPLADRLDSIRRFMVVSRAVLKTENHELKAITNPTAVANDLRYDQIYPKAVAEAAWQKSPAAYTANRDNVEYLVKNPPANTRAAARTSSVELFRDKGVYNVTWDLIRPDEHRSLHMGDPYDTTKVQLPRIPRPRDASPKPRVPRQHRRLRLVTDESQPSNEAS